MNTHGEFLFLRHSIPEMIIFENRYGKNNVIFLECAVVVTCLYKLTINL